MTAISTRPTKIGDLLKGEFWPEAGYERQTRTLTLAGDGSEQIGAVFKADGTIVVAADVAGLGGNDVAILIDDTVYDDPTSVEEDLAVLSGGPAGSGGAVVVREQLKFGDALSPAQVTSVVAVIESKGIKVSTQV